VKPGDTVHSLAERYRVPVRNIIDLNRLRPPYRLISGQPLLIPKPREHRVASGETVYGISRRYGVDMSALVKLNGIVPPYTIRVGEALRLPAVVETQVLSVATSIPPTPEPAASLTHVPASSGSSGKSGVVAEELPASAAPPGATEPLLSSPPTASTSQPKPATPVAGIVPSPEPRSGSRFLWPVEGKILSGFGPKKGGLHNDGINIAAAQGAPVYAAENGVVAYAGNELRGFGNLLLIKHADGWTSAYAHNEELLVRRGDRVKRGQIIAKVGSSGSVTSPQLHFELRNGARAVDPVRLLSPAQAGL
jgi:murein DD-endopeptidase MepM/ murein hydrolase activator NlpD